MQLATNGREENRFLEKSRYSDYSFEEVGALPLLLQCKQELLMHESLSRLSALDKIYYIHLILQV